MNIKDRIKKLEQESFFRTWYKNTNEDLEILDSNTGNKVTVKNTDLHNILSQFLNAFENNTNHKIVGADIMHNFVIKLSSKEDLIKVAQDVWDNPEKYHNWTGDSYYEFLKFLWIESDEFPGETRLTDIINT